MKKLLLIKLGGGLITDKTKPFTVDQEALQKVSDTLSSLFREYGDEYAIIVGNGAGSFGHHVAQMYASEKGHYSPQAVCEIHHSVVKLNEIVVHALLDAGLPAYALSLGSCIVCEAGSIVHTDFSSIDTLLNNNAIPVVFGDCVPDTAHGGTSLSTERHFSVLVERFVQDYGYTDVTIIFVGKEKGVLDASGEVIQELTTENLRSHDSAIGASHGIDVTGGMKHKVESAIEMAKKGNRVFIVSGGDDALLRLMAGEHVGTFVIG